MSTTTSRRPEHVDFFFKIILVGDYKTGKTSLLCKYMNQEYKSTENNTSGVDFSVKTLLRDDKKIKLQIWDTAGQERFRTAVASYYRNARGVLLVYDITSRQSFHNIGYWYDEMIHNCPGGNIKGVLVGNNCHMECEREVSSEEGKTFAEQFNLLFFETSVKKDINVIECFEELVDSILNEVKQQEICRSLEGIILPDNSRRVNLHPQNPEIEGCTC